MSQPLEDGITENLERAGGDMVLELPAHPGKNIHRRQISRSPGAAGDRSLEVGWDTTDVKKTGTSNPP